MNRPTLLVTRRLPPRVLEAAAQVFELRLWEQDKPIGDAFEAWAHGCDGVLMMNTDRLGRVRLQALGAGGVRAVGTYSGGCDHIDLNAASACGLPVFNTPDVPATLGNAI